MSFPPPPPPPPPGRNGNASRFPTPPPPPGGSSLQQHMNNLHVSEHRQQNAQQQHQANHGASSYGFPMPPPSSAHSESFQQQQQPAINRGASAYGFQPPPPPPARQQFQPPPPPPPNHGFPPPPNASQQQQQQYQPPPPPPGPPMQQNQQFQQPPPMPPSHGTRMGPPPQPSPYGYNQGPPKPPGPANGMPPTPIPTGHRPPSPNYGGGRPPPPNYGGRPPTPNAPQGQQSQQQQDHPRIDPSQIPRPPIFTRPDDNGHLPIYSTKAAAAQTRIAPPPPADSRYLVNDDGNASPQVMRSNMYTIPLDRGTWQKIGELDLGVLCSPLALPSEDFSPTWGPQPDETMSKGHATLDPQRIPVIQPTPDTSGTKNLPPPRCRNCQAYMNPYWDSNSNSCNFCGSKSSNANFDITCLQRGTVDFVVDGPYVTRSSPVQPIFLYALDLTCPHLVDYMDLLEQVGQDVARHFQQQPSQQRLLHQRQQEEHSQNDHGQDVSTVKPLLQQQRPRIGLCFVGANGIVVLTKSGPQGTMHASIMPDVEEPFCHLPLQEWTFDLSTVEGTDAWTQHIQEDLLEGEILKKLRKEAKKKNAHGLDGYELSCGGAAMAFCADALMESGGRATWITHRRPNFGAGAIRQRGSKAQAQGRAHPEVEDGVPLQELSKPSNGQDEKAAQFYRLLQEKCNKNRVVLDIVVHSNHEYVMHQHLDLATQGEVCRATCGKLSWITAPGDAWKEPLFEELKRPLLSFQGWDAVLKVRCSVGLDVKGFVSHPGVAMDGGGLSGSPELELSCVSPQTSVAVLLEHRVGGIPKKSSFVYVQSALLYSTLSGERRVRVSTLCLRPTTNVSDIFLSIDFSAFSTLYLRQAVARLRQSAKTKASKEDVSAWQRQAREDITNQIVKLFMNYRKNTNAVHSPPGQLILPEKLQLLPLFGMCLMKSPLFRPSLGRRIGNSVAVSPTNDERAYYAFQATMVTPSAAMLLVHPYVFSIGKPLGEGVGEWRTPVGAETAVSELGQASYHSSVQLPPSVNASMTSVQEDGTYLIDNGLVIFLFFGKLVPEEVKQELAQVSLSSSLSPFEMPTDYGQRIRRILWQLRTFCSVGTNGSRSEARPVFPPVIPVHQGHPRHQIYEQEIMNWMVDDPNSGEKDYSDFLCKLHRLIREKMSPSSK